jgi:hypothetical protein
MNKFIAFLCLALIVILSFSSFNLIISKNTSSSEDTFEIPENIDTIFKGSCYGCHSIESKNYKARMKLKLDQLTIMKKSKLISKLSKIAKEVEKGDMPTKKFVEEYPNRVPTNEEKKILIDWARNAVRELTGE